MQVGSLVKLNCLVSDGGLYKNLRGIVLSLFKDREDNPKASVIWTDGDKTHEWQQDLEVICK